MRLFVCRKESQGRNETLVDKSLKKLSRMELLELLVSLSEDYERLSVENERLRRKPPAPRLSKNTKIGSIAEAALQANGYFTAAQRSADEYLREIKRLRDELALRTQQVREQGFDPRQGQMQAQAQAQASAILRDANARANQIISQAQQEAQAIIGDAQRRAAGQVSHGQQDYQRHQRYDNPGASYQRSAAPHNPGSVQRPFGAGQRGSAPGRDFRGYPASGRGAL